MHAWMHLRLGVRATAHVASRAVEARACGQAAPLELPFFQLHQTTISVRARAGLGDEPLATIEARVRSSPGGTVAILGVPG